MARDDREAAKWYRLAADQGNVKAQTSLGFMYEKGEGVPQDYAKSLIWYRLAAQQGSKQAQYNLALMYDKGEGIGQDSNEAVFWYRRAAQQELAAAQHNLGLMYLNGQGVAQDYVVAYGWVGLATSSSANGDERKRAMNNRQAIALKMTPQQITRAEDWARRCRGSDYKQCE